MNRQGNPKGTNPGFHHRGLWLKCPIACDFYENEKVCTPFLYKLCRRKWKSKLKQCSWIKKMEGEKKDGKSKL